MKTYIGIKNIMAKPMTRLEYNDYRGWSTPHNEDVRDEGYLIEYIEGGTLKDDSHAKYISWRPKDVFDKTYRASGSLNFGMAIEAVKNGQHLSRKGWNGKGQYIFLVRGEELCVNDLENKHANAIAIKTISGEIQVGWLASQGDMMADDWEIV